MKKLLSGLCLLAIMSSAVAEASPFSFLFSRSNNEAFGSSSWVNKETSILKSQASNINEKVLRLSLTAYLHAKRQGRAVKPYLTVIDFSKASYEKRLWVFDMSRNRELYNTWVTHGKNSGGVEATSFSNTPGSLKSSLGVFLTDEPYMGGNGYSLRLRGLERGVNDNAYRRDIVIHGAWYANAATIRKYGQAGRSWGCPAISNDLARPVINTIKGSSMVFAYYPDRNWLSHSQYLA